MPPNTRTTNAGGGNSTDGTQVQHFPPLSHQHDGQKVTNRPLKIVACPTDLDERLEWIEDIEMTCNVDSSGIRWMETASTVSSVLETEQFSEDLRRDRIFTINCVVQFNIILSSTRNTAFHLTADADGNMCKLKIPTRIWNALSSHVYSLLKPSTRQKNRLFRKKMPTFLQP
jgi:hypothetical protein